MKRVTRGFIQRTCVFPKRDLALTLTNAQWAQCRCVCKGKTVSTLGSKEILCHNTANHFATQTPANDRLSSPEHNNKTEPRQDKNLIAICCSSSADVNNCSSINNPKNDKSKDYSYSDAELNSTCSQRWKPVGSTGRSGCRSGRDSSTGRSSRLKNRSNFPFWQLKDI